MIDSSSRDDKDSVKQFTIVLQPVNKSEKTVYLNGKQNISQSGNTESISSHSREECSPKDSKLPSELTENSLGCCQLESITMEATDKLQLQPEESCQIPVESVTLKKTPRLKQRLPTKRKNSTLERLNTDQASNTNQAHTEVKGHNGVLQMSSSDNKLPSEFTENSSECCMLEARSPKDRELSSELTENSLECCMSKSITIKTPDKTQLECELEQSSQIQNKPAPQRWIESVTLKNTPDLKQWLSTKKKNSALEGFITEPASNTNEPHKEAETEILQVSTLGKKKKKEKKIHPDFMEGSKVRRLHEKTNQSTSSFAKTLGMEMCQKWLTSVNLEKSPLIPKQTSFCIQKQVVPLDQDKFEVESSKKGVRRKKKGVRRNISFSNEASTLSQNDSSEKDQQEQSECLMDTRQHPNTTAVADDECSGILASNGDVNVSVPDVMPISNGKLLKSVEISPIHCVKSSLKEGTLQNDGKSIQNDDNAFCKNLDEIHPGESMQNASSENCKSSTALCTEKPNKRRSSRKLLLLKTKTFVERQKRKRTLSGSLVPEKKRLRRFSSCIPTDFPEDGSTQKMSFVPERDGTHDKDKHFTELNVSSEIHQQDTTETSERDVTPDVIDDWLLCDRSVDSIPADDEPEPEVLLQRQDVIHQDHSYSIRSHKSDVNHPNIKTTATSHGVNDRKKMNKNMKKASKSGKEKSKRMKRALTNYELQKKYDLSVPLKNLTIYCEHLNPDSFNIISMQEKTSKKSVIHSKRKSARVKKSARVNVKGKRKELKNQLVVTGRPKKTKVPLHYKALKPEQIKTIKHMNMRYRVAFHLWPQRYSSALDKINQRIINQNAFWKSLQ